MVDPMLTAIEASAPRRRAYLDRLGDYTPADEYHDEDSPELNRRIPVQRARYDYDGDAIYTGDGDEIFRV